MFEAVIIEIPTEDAAKKGELGKLVLGPKCIMAKDIEAAALAIVLKAAKDATVRLPDANHMDVIVRPFK